MQPALLELLNSGLNADVEIITSDNQVFKAHKCILMCRSPKFHGMFGNDTAELHDNKVYLTETDGFLFDKLLKWIYSGSVLMPNEVDSVC